MPSNRIVARINAPGIQTVVCLLRCPFTTESKTIVDTTQWSTFDNGIMLSKHKYVTVHCGFGHNT